MSHFIRPSAGGQPIPAPAIAMSAGDLGAPAPHLLTPARRRALVDLLVSAARRTLTAGFLLGLALLWSMPAHAQEVGPNAAQPPNSGDWLSSSEGILEVRPFAGAFLPTGPARTDLKSALLAGAQVSARLVPQLAVTGTFAWTPNNDRTLVGEPTLDVYQYDLGLEARGAGWFEGDGWDFTPFVGVGGGGRTYDYRNIGVGSTTDVDGYGAVGGELGYGRLGLRVEARDYISQFHPLNGIGLTTNHNDVDVAAGLRLRL
jgi:hypothetical protein